MIIATFGPPSAFSQWCLHVLNIMAGVVFERFDYVSVSTAQDFRSALANRQNEHMSFFTDCPDQGLVEAFERTHLPFLVLYEDPEDVTGFIMRERELSWGSAVRLTNMTFVTLAELFTSTRTLRVKRDETLTIGAFLQQVTTHVGLDVRVEQFDTIVARVAPDGNALQTMEAGLLSLIRSSLPIGVGLDLTEEQRAVVEPLHTALRICGQGGTITNLRWPSELFVAQGGMDTLLTGPIEMLGPARCLVYGPYLHLPAGLWEVTVVLEIEENYSGNHVDVDIFHGTVLHLQSFSLPPSGRLALITRFPVKDGREPIQIRVIQREGAIEGLLTIGDVQVRRIDDAALRQAS